MTVIQHGFVGRRSRNIVVSFSQGLIFFENKYVGKDVKCKPPIVSMSRDCAYLILLTVANDGSW